LQNHQGQKDLLGTYDKTTKKKINEESGRKKEISDGTGRRREVGNRGDRETVD
jgi:hypothetical protein